VGFIRKLPHALVAAFRATLEEVLQADLLLHVSDGTSVDRAAQEAAVGDVLSELGAGDRPCLHVVNKVDQLEPARRDVLASMQADTVLVSARDGSGLPDLRQLVARRLGLMPQRRRMRFALADGEAIAAVHRVGQVHSQEVAGDGVSIDADVPAWFLEQYAKHLL
jgi:GTP-binding protein HflX